MYLDHILPQLLPYTLSTDIPNILLSTSCTSPFSLIIYSAVMAAWVQGTSTGEILVSQGLWKKDFCRSDGWSKSRDHVTQWKEHWLRLQKSSNSTFSLCPSVSYTELPDCQYKEDHICLSKLFLRTKSENISNVPETVWKVSVRNLLSFTSTLPLHMGQRCLICLLR